MEPIPIRAPDASGPSAECHGPVASPASDALIGIGKIRVYFGLGRTAAYQLTRRRDFPAPIVLSARCYRWRAGQVHAYAASLQEPDRQPPAGPTPALCCPPERGAALGPQPLRIAGAVRYARRHRKTR